MITMTVILVVRNTEEETGIKSQQIYLKTTLINSSSFFFQFKDLEVFILEAWIERETGKRTGMTRNMLPQFSLSPKETEKYNAYLS